MLDILGKSKNAKKIMLILSKFKRLALKEIAKKIKIHENSVRTVLKKLEQNEIINYIVVKTVIGDKSVKEYFGITYDSDKGVNITLDLIPTLDKLSKFLLTN